MCAMRSPWMPGLALISVVNHFGCASPQSAPECTQTEIDCKGDKCGGWVIVEFDISLAGAVQNPQIVDFCPPGRFDSAVVLNAVSKWRYNPPAAPKHMRTKLTFKPPP